MTEIINFILSNYAWILVVVLIILLAIIGSVAEKSFFGIETKIPNDGDQKKEKYNELKNKKMSDLFKNNEKYSEESTSNSKILDNNVITNEAVNNAANKDNKQVEITNFNNIENKFEQKSMMSSLEDKLKDLDKEINDILPKREVLDNDFIDEFEDLSMDLDAEKKTKDDFDLSDIELPQIKKSKTSKKNIWQ